MKNESRARSFQPNDVKFCSYHITLSCFFFWIFPFQIENVIYRSRLVCTVMNCVHGLEFGPWSRPRAQFFSTRWLKCIYNRYLLSNSNAKACANLLSRFFLKWWWIWGELTTQNNYDQLIISQNLIFKTRQRLEDGRRMWYLPLMCFL